LRPILSHDWQNAYADFSVNLKSELQAIEGRERRAEAIARMRKILEEYKTSRRQRRMAG
jgi:metallo-beta-lactamase family protein